MYGGSLMNKKITIALILAVALGSGAFAQLMIGGSGAMYFDTTVGLTAEQIANSFGADENTWYGGFLEIAGKNIGVGFSFNSSPSYTDSLGFVWSNYDAAFYIAYHLFGAKAFLDPLGEFGIGALAQTNDQSSNIVTGTGYWYGAAGLGINLGPLGVFAKFAYDFKLPNHLKVDDELGNKVEVPYYRVGDGDMNAAGYMPNFRFNAGIKLIL
jgi:hypothetical protein